MNLKSAPDICGKTFSLPNEDRFWGGGGGGEQQLRHLTSTTYEEKL